MVPPIPIFKNKVLEHYTKPKIFEEHGDTGAEDNNNKSNYYFDGWSFVNNNSSK